MSQLPVLDPREAYRLWADSYPPYAHNALMLAEERAMLSLLPADLSGYNVLDAGCGSGRYMLHVCRRGAAHVIGVDMSTEMLRRAQMEAFQNNEPRSSDRGNAALIQASLEALPLRDRWADVTLCGLTLGHLSSLTKSLTELRRVTRPGGLLLCSDFHPVGEALGWKRVFKADGERYSVRHTSHTLDSWKTACREIGLHIQNALEPCIDLGDVPPGAQFDTTALETPVVLILGLGRP